MSEMVERLMDDPNPIVIRIQPRPPYWIEHRQIEAFERWADETKMSEMVERVAKAIAALDDMEWNAPDIHSEFFRMQARAAIEAMREPTQRMYEAVASHPDEMLRTNIAEIWQAMIDAAIRP